MTILYTKYQISYRKNQTAVNGVIYEKSFRVFLCWSPSFRVDLLLTFPSNVKNRLVWKFSVTLNGTLNIAYKHKAIDWNV